MTQAPSQSAFDDAAWRVEVLLAAVSAARAVAEISFCVFGASAEMIDAAAARPGARRNVLANHKDGAERDIVNIYSAGEDLIISLHGIDRPRAAPAEASR